MEKWSLLTLWDSNHMQHACSCHLYIWNKTSSVHKYLQALASLFHSMTHRQVLCWGAAASSCTHTHVLPWYVTPVWPWPCSALCIFCVSSDSVSRTHPHTIGLTAERLSVEKVLQWGWGHRRGEDDPWALDTCWIWGTGVTKLPSSPAQFLVH